MGRHPGGLVFERPGEAGAMAGPGHSGHDHPMLGAEDPWGVCLEVGGDDAEVECSPLALAFAIVIARATLSALAATPPLSALSFASATSAPSPSSNLALKGGVFLFDWRPKAAAICCCRHP